MNHDSTGSACDRSRWITWIDVLQNDMLHYVPGKSVLKRVLDGLKSQLRGLESGGGNSHFGLEAHG